MKTTIPFILRTTRSDRRAARGGQAIIFLLMAMVILAFVVMWNFDVHKIVKMKNVTQNAGDSAALMASRWQGVTLNLVGDLNLLHALALSTGEADTATSCTNVQARILFVGPMIAFMASQQAAKNNGVYRNPEYDDAIREHATKVRFDYPAAVGQNGEMLFPEPYPGCWNEYADMLDLAAEEGVAVGPENVRFYGDAIGGHILYTIAFYDAIAGRNWCWFYHNAPTLLQDYRNFFPCWWPPLPEPPRTRPLNCEIYGLGMAKANTTTFDTWLTLNDASEFAVQRGLGDGMNETGMTTEATWYTYSSGRWGDWEAIRYDGDRQFPVVGPVRDEYDYSGADAAVRVETTSERITPGPEGGTQENTVLWTAAAKPFGHLGDGSRPNDYQIVLPAYHDVRLIPIDASSAPAGGGFDLGWREHCEQHLPDYMDNGPTVLPRGCYYCNQLRTWENPSFRQSGVNWLAANSARCIVRRGGGGGGGGGWGGRGGGSGGGTRRGH